MFHEQENMIRLLALGWSPSETAEAVGVTPATVYARLRMPLFKALVAEARGKMLEKHAGKATEMIDAALDVLNDVMGDSDDDKVRVAAAGKIVDISLKLRNESMLYPRLAAVEAALADSGIDLPSTDDLTPPHVEAPD